MERGKRKSCPNCRAKLVESESIWSWGEYINGKWRNVTDFCKECFDEVVLGKCFELQPHRPREISIKGGVRPCWMRLEPDYHPDLVAMLVACREKMYDASLRLVTADACGDQFHRPDLETVLRAQAQAFIWASKTKMCERATLVVSRDDYKYGKVPRKKTPFSFFGVYGNLDAILLACGPPHAFGFEVVDDLNSAGEKGHATLGPTPLLFADNGGWYRDPETRLRPFQCNYCYFVKPIPEHFWPKLMAELKAQEWPRHEGDEADGREPVRVWKRWDFRFELYDMEQEKPPSHRRMGYRLYFLDNLVARNFDIGVPQLVCVDSDDALIGVMRWVEAKDAVVLEWEDNPHRSTFDRTVRDLHQLFDASKHQARFSTWCCPCGLVVGHQVLDCVACWEAYRDRLREAQNQEMGAT